MRLLTLFSICLFLSNCSGKKPVQNEIVVEVEEKQQRVFFKWPKDGSSVASAVFIVMGV